MNQNLENMAHQMGLNPRDFSEKSDKRKKSLKKSESKSKITKQQIDESQEKIKQKILNKCPVQVEQPKIKLSVTYNVVFQGDKALKERLPAQIKKEMIDLIKHELKASKPKTINEITMLLVQRGYGIHTVLKRKIKEVQCNMKL